MKITVKGSKLIEKLKAQRDRSVAKRDEATIQTHGGYVLPWVGDTFKG